MESSILSKMLSVFSSLTVTLQSSEMLWFSEAAAHIVAVPGLFEVTLPFSST